MTFERPWVLLFFALPAAWALIQWRASALVAQGRLRLILKALAVAAVIVALSEPRVESTESKLAVAALVDTSASISAADLERANGLVKQLNDESGRHDLRIVPFARAARSRAAGEKSALSMTAGEAGRGTDLESAIREAAAALPERRVPRLALISDGKENRGSVMRAAWQMRGLGIPIDVFPLKGRPRPALRLDGVGLPAQAFAGERFSVELQVNSPQRTEATVEITAEGKVLGTSNVLLEKGENTVRAAAALTEAGAVDLGGSVKAGSLGEVRFARAITLRRPRLLYLSQDPPGTESNLAQAATAARFDFERSEDAANAPLAGRQIVALNNIDLESLSDDRKAELETFVKQGGGLVVIGGERNIYMEKKKDVPENALERSLPAKLAPPRSPEGTCVILIVDKSSSMEGRKMELARLAAIGVIENLRPIDMVGVLIFDNSYLWAVPIRKAEDKNLIKRLVAGITPDGGTQIAPALSEAFRKAVPVKATFKHIVLLTDGISEEGDSISVAKEAAALRITISTVGLGQDVNRAYLEKVASFSKGRSYFLIDPSGLEQILLRDVMEHTGSTAIERSVAPIVTKRTEILEGVGMESAPALKGYVKFESKPSAETILAIDTGSQGQDPLLARWQYGLGRAAVFASDAKSRWAEDWVKWPGYEKLWTNLLRDLLPHSSDNEVSTEYDAATATLVVHYRLGPGVPEPTAPPTIYALGPDNFRQPLTLERLAAGTYRGRVKIGDMRGLFRLRPLEESRAFPETGFYRDEEELNSFGANEDLLKQVASYTGGLYNPPPAEVFRGGGRSIPAIVELWPSFLFAAILLSLAELLLRKWPGLILWRAARA